MRLSLKIPESPIERQAFRSRTFRRLIFTAGAFSLCLATIHNITAKNEFHQERAILDYLKFRRTSSSFDWMPHSQPVSEAQVSFKAPVERTESHNMEDLMKQLPEVIRIPFQEAVSDVELDGWEDEWFSSATYNYDKKLVEPKLDFVYNCKLNIETPQAVTDMNYRG